MFPLNSHSPVGFSTRLSRVMQLTVVWGVLAVRWSSAAQDSSIVPLPPGVKAVWDQAQAYRETTPTRERLCINGLWRWQPAADNAIQVPTEAWVGIERLVVALHV